MDAIYSIRGDRISTDSCQPFRRDPVLMRVIRRARSGRHTPADRPRECYCPPAFAW